MTVVEFFIPEKWYVYTDQVGTVVFKVIGITSSKFGNSAGVRIYVANRAFDENNTFYPAPEGHVIDLHLYKQLSDDEALMYRMSE